MDLGISGRKAIVCGSSHGLGRACAMALAEEGVTVVLNGRYGDALAAARRDIEAVAGGSIEAVIADVTTPEGRAALLAACPNPDILINNSGGPPAGSFRDLTHEDWLAALNANMLSALDLIRSTVDAMMENGFGRIVNITSGAVKAPIAGLDLSNGARSGLTGVVAGLARTTVHRNVTINNLLPGSFNTRRIDEYYTKMASLDPNTDVATLIAQDLEQQPSGRFGEPEEFGAACAFLCSARAGYINGQNLLLDGGEFPGTL
jgi:3-oxoacyl-[acyl-carrier protein] reductase